MANEIKHFTAGSAPRSYGRDGTEIYVARRGDVSANRELVANLKNDFTRAVLLADRRDITPVLYELQSLIRTTNADCLRLNVHCANHDDFTKNFAEKLSANYNHYNKHLPRLHQEPFIALQGDIDRTLGDIADHFDLSQSFDLVIHHDLKRDAVHRLGDARGANWHVDGATVVTRPLSPAGTLLGFNADDTVKTHAGGNGVMLRPASCAEVGQGVYILKGDVVHSTPVIAKPRWFYAITSLSLR